MAPSRPTTEIHRIDRRGPLSRLRRSPDGIGSKAEGIATLAARGFRVPCTFAIQWSADPGGAKDASRAAHEYAQAALAHPAACPGPLAVRSSANTEDDPDHSFAGQFESVLDVNGEDELARAIRLVWDSVRTERVRTYAEMAGVDPSTIRMAVIVQQQVPAKVSGVAFGRNPTTGLDEIVVEAVKGSGERLGREGVTPSRWVWKWGAFTAEDDHEDIERATIEKVVRGTQHIQAVIEAPVDLEWCWDGTHVWWVQVREITALRKQQIFSNRISREVLPGLITPLVWSVNTRLVNGAWVELITELIGTNDISPRSLSRTFYSRAYFDMGTFGRIFDAFGMPKESLEILMGIESGGDERPSLRPSVKALRHTGRLARFAWNKARLSRTIDEFLASIDERYSGYGPLDAAARTDTELVDRVASLFELGHEAAYLNIVTPLFARLTSRSLSRRLESYGIDPGSFDTRGDEAKWGEVDPARGMRGLRAAYREAAPEVRKLVEDGEYETLRSDPRAAGLVEELGAYLERFGHLSDSGNDFSSPTWAERPGDVLKAVGAGEVAGAEAGSSWDTLEISDTHRRRLGRTYRRASAYEYYRESVGSAYTRAYGLFRPYFLEIGRRLRDRGLLEAPEDAFFLYNDELPEVLLGRSEIDPIELVSRRKAEFEYAGTLVAPETVFGDDPEPMEPGEFTSLSGTPTSRGQHRGRAVQVSGLGDASRLREGDVLFVPYTDVAWTPLFAHAGAVVAESGGFLSHSSIVARERGIPAVVSVSGATQVPEGTEVLVDGYSGTVTLLDAQAAS